jgi:hypothetical protein
VDRRPAGLSPVGTDQAVEGLLLHREPLEGRAAIIEHRGASFRRFGTSAWDARTQLVEVHGDRACAYRTYTEHLRERATGARTLIRGRLAYFRRRDDGTTWRAWLLLQSRSHPMEPMA